MIEELRKVVGELLSDLDGVVALPQAGLKPGDWVRARFLAATPYDIWAHAC